MTQQLQAKTNMPPALPPQAATRFSTAAEVAIALRISTMTVYRLVKDGELPGYRFGKNVLRIPTQAVWDYMRGSKIDPDDLSRADSLGSADF